MAKHGRSATDDEYSDGEEQDVEEEEADVAAPTTTSDGEEHDEAEQADDVSTPQSVASLPSSA